MASWTPKVVAGLKKYSVTKKRRRVQRSDDEENESPPELRALRQAQQKLLQNNQDLANELSSLRRGNLDKMRRINVLTRELISMRLKSLATTSSACTQTEDEKPKILPPLNSMPRRIARRISYAEPSLKTKMRRPADFRS